MISTLLIVAATTDCGAPPIIDNGMVNWTSTTVGSNATYTCNTGHVLTHIDPLLCNNNDSWNPDPPFCISKCTYHLLCYVHVLLMLIVVDCGPLSPIGNGRVNVSSTTFGSNAMYSCNTGYTLKGNDNRTCTGNGTWSAVTPTCDRTYCYP